MKKILNHVKGKGRIILIPFITFFALFSVFIYNSFQKTNSAVVYAGNGTYVESSGTVESNSVDISSEVSGTVIEYMFEEGDIVNKGDIIAKINNTNLKNQYDQAVTNIKVAEKNIEMIENNINNLKLQNTDAAQQAQNAYLAVSAEYEKVMEGASVDEIRQAEESVNQAKINFDYIKANLDRNKELLEQEAISQTMYDETLKNYNISEAQYNSAVSKLNLLKSYPTDSSLKAAKNKMLQAKSGYELAISNGNTQINQLKGQLEIAKIQLEQYNNILLQTQTEAEKLTIKSPINGLINSLFIKQGEFISIGKVLAEIYHEENVEIKAYVSEANIGNIKVGQSVEIYTDSDISKIFEGKVIKINDKAEFTPKNIQTKEERVNTVFEVKVKVLNSEGVIKPGMPVDIKIKIN
jgi:HlyD family secretion protein